MNMFPHDPGTLDEHLVRHRERVDRLGGGHSTSSLRGFDMMWGSIGFAFKALTSPIWFPISWWQKRKRRLQQRDTLRIDKKPYY